MKKRLAIILLICIVTVIAFPGVTALAQPVKTPHENPDTATGSLDTISLLISYSKIFIAASNREYATALEALEELRKIDIPDEYRNIIDRYNDLCQQLFTTLDTLDATLEKASNLIENNKIDEAKSILDDAEVYIQDAAMILYDVNLTTESLRKRFGVMAPAAADELLEADKRLQDSIEQLKKLLDMLNNLKISLNERYVEKKGLLLTSITLEINPTSAYIGDSIRVEGVLRSSHEPLSGRRVTIILDEETTAMFTTREDGSYTGNITIPYRYKETIKAFAVYEPRASDIDMYLACQSPEVVLETRFYPTQLQVSTPGIIYPGIPFSINGEIISEANDIERTIEVRLDNTQIIETRVSGQFSLEITPPDNAATGQRNLIIEVAPRERYAGAYRLHNITIALIPLEMDMETPGLIILPGSIELSGRVQSESGPAADARVNIVFGDISTTATTTSDGSFATKLDVPLDISFMEPRGLSIDVEALEPWIGSLSIKRQAFVINPVFTGLTLLILVALAFVLIRRRRTPEYKAMPREEVVRAPAYIIPQAPAIKLTGIKGRIISAYRTGLVIIEKIVGVRMTPDLTLREFLAKVTKLLPGIARQLTELTAMVERALYSDQTPTKKTASTAEQITDDIQQELRRGA